MWAAHHQVVLIGTGLAGLSAAHELQEKYYINATLFEARERSGGCVYTERNLANNATMEHGGCFIDSDHEAIIQLTQEMGCSLRRVINDKKALYHQFIDNKLSNSDDNFERFRPFLEALSLDMVAYIFQDIYFINKIKNIYLSDYLDSKKIPTELKKLINLTIQNEYGADIDNMWAYELFQVISLAINKKIFSLNGELGDEAFIIDNGGDKLILKLEQSLKNKINYGYELISISQENNYYRLNFKNNHEIISVTSDYIIITVPVEVLRESVVFEIKDFPNYLHEFMKRRHCGNNIKTCLFFSEPIWNTLENGNRFNLLTEHFWIWDNSDLDKNQNCFGLTAFAGGSNALRASTLLDAEIENEILDSLSKYIPNVRAFHVMTKRGHNWLNDPFSRGSYAGIVEPGLYPVEEAYVRPFFNNLFFAGAAWSKEFEGFMNGAVVTGKAAALRLFKTMKK